jgi:putative ABC transport system permease protein
MRAIDRKMLRDLVHMRGQVAAICLVMACGVATFVMSLGTLESLERTLETYYERYRFAEAFAHVKRAPEALARRIAEIPGVARVQTRIVEQVTLDMPGLAEPAVGRLISRAEREAAPLNDLYLRSGRLLAPGRNREVLVGEGFALAHGLEPGARVTAILNGRLDELHVVGIVLSPEYIYQISEGDIIPDEKRFGVFWMNEDELAAAFDMEGAFNDVTLTLMPGAQEDEVLARLDRLTETYGGLGAYARADQISHKFIDNEINEMRATAKMVPVIFLGVAAFLLNVVLSRLISTQREQIAAMKAVGYTKLEIGAHYLELVLIIVLVAVALGTAVGIWMGSGLTRLYTQFFHFPIFEFHLSPSVIPLALLVSVAAGVLGTVGAVRSAVRLPPAEAMRPAPPATYRPTILERIGLRRLLSPALRMILRQLERRPFKSALSCFGIALAASILVLGFFMEDAIDYVMDFEFETVQRHDLAVQFVEPQSPDALNEVRSLPGVAHCEPFRAIAARLHSGHRSRRIGITGVRPDGDLFNLIDLDERPVPLPPEGVVVSVKLAELLGVAVGDMLTVEVLQETRPVRQVPLAGVIADFAGMAAYMHIDAANRLMRQEDVLTGAYIATEPGATDTLYERLRAMPNVAGVSVKQAAVESFRNTIAESILLMRTFNIIFAVIIAFGVVYNSARISLAERSRELATLRVIGFTRAEISLIQLGELGVLTLLAIPGGLAMGYGLAALTSAAYDTELFRIPLVVSRATFGISAGVVLVAAIVSGLIVRRMIDRLELVSVLKTKE